MAAWSQQSKLGAGIGKLGFFWAWGNQVHQINLEFSFFPSFLKNLKLILQYLHSQNHKEYLRKKATEQHEDADDPELGIATACEPLDHQVERFANWRWRTIMKANDDLERHISLLVCVATGLPPSKWSLKEGAPLKAISELVAKLFSTTFINTK